MIELKDIGITFHAGTPDENTALKNINLKINQGDFITVIGSNGAGKSTLYNIIAGTLTPTVGNIYLDEIKEDGSVAKKEITNDAEYKRAAYIGRIFQNPLLGTAGKMSLEDNMIICSKKGWHGLRISLNKKKREEFKEQLKQLNMGLEERLNDNVELLSGGQRQALTLLMSVLSKPALLLLDEHTAALDPATAEKVLELTRRIVAQRRLTCLMITHNMQCALSMGSRTIIMDSGRISLDVSGAEREAMTVEQLLGRFRENAGKTLVSDRMLLVR